MISMLTGRFYKLKEYYSTYELLKYYLYMIDFVHSDKDIILRFYHNPYDYNVSALGYLSISYNAVIVLLRENTPIKRDSKVFYNIMRSQQGFIEVFKLSRHEFEIDREMLHSNFQVLGGTPEEYILEFKINRLRDEIIEMLGSSDQKVEETSGDRLVYSHEASMQLEDVTYRANILLRRDYRLIETGSDDLLRVIDRILSEKNNVVLIIRLGSTCVWLIKRSNKVGLRVFSDSSVNNLKIGSFEGIKDIINKIISQHKGVIKRARIFIYDLT